MQATTPNTILLVDDDAEIREIARVLLESEGFRVIEAVDGENALTAFSADIDLVILDIMMPGISGYQVCRSLREQSNVPILFLTAKSQDGDLTMGFSSGGDDYLSKPFSYTELLARVKGLLRRYKIYKGDNRSEISRFIEWRGIKLDCERNDVWKAEKEIILTEKAYQILRLLLIHRGKIFSAQNLYESVWEEPYYAPSSNTVMVHIRKLREKIEDNPEDPKILKTVWGKGYRIE